MPIFTSNEPHELRIVGADGEREIRYFPRGVEIEADESPGKFWVQGRKSDLKYDARFDGQPPPDPHVYPSLIRAKPGAEPAYVTALRKAAGK